MCSQGDMRRSPPKRVRIASILPSSVESSFVWSLLVMSKSVRRSGPLNTLIANTI